MWHDGNPANPAWQLRHWQLSSICWGSNSRSRRHSDFFTSQTTWTKPILGSLTGRNVINENMYNIAAIPKTVWHYSQVPVVSESLLSGSLSLLVMIIIASVMGWAGGAKAPKTLRAFQNFNYARKQSIGETDWATKYYRKIISKRKGNPIHLSSTSYLICQKLIQNLTILSQWI